MRFTVTFACDNAAFGDEPETEIVRILNEIAARVEREGIQDADDAIFDCYGNRVGRWDITN